MKSLIHRLAFCNFQDDCSAFEDLEAFPELQMALVSRTRVSRRGKETVAVVRLILWTPRARADLAAIRAFIEQNSPRPGSSEQALRQRLGDAKGAV